MTIFALADIESNSDYAIVDGLRLDKGDAGLDLTDDQILRLHKAGQLSVSDLIPVDPTIPHFRYAVYDQNTAETGEVLVIAEDTGEVDTTGEVPGGTVIGTPVSVSPVPITEATSDGSIILQQSGDSDALAIFFTPGISAAVVYPVTVPPTLLPKNHVAVQVDVHGEAVGDVFFGVHDGLSVPVRVPVGVLIQNGDAPYVLPQATSSELGGVLLNAPGGAARYEDLAAKADASALSTKANASDVSVAFKVAPQKTISTSTHTIDLTDVGYELCFTAACAVLLPTGLTPQQCWFTITNDSGGVVSVTAATGVTFVDGGPVPIADQASILFRQRPTANLWKVS